MTSRQETEKDASLATFAEGEQGPLFTGWEPRECGDHRPVGDYRAWCFDCSEWCYSRTIDMACKGCEIVHLRRAIPSASTSTEETDRG